MEKLTKEEVLRVANLAKIEIDETEIETYQYKLKEILTEIDKINEVVNYDEEIMISPITHNATLREDKSGEMLDPKVVASNAPRKSGNFIEVPVVINEEV